MTLYRTDKTVWCKVRENTTIDLGEGIHVDMMTTNVRRDKCWIKYVQALKNPNPLKFDGRLEVFVVAGVL